MLPDPLQNPNQPRLRNDQRVAVHQEKAVRLPHATGGIEDVAQNDPLLFDPKALVPVGAAKGATVVGASDRNLKQDASGFAGRPDAIPLIMHSFLFGDANHV